MKTKCALYNKADDCAVKCPDNADIHCDIEQDVIVTPETLKNYKPLADKDLFMCWTSPHKYVKGQLIFRRIP